MTFRVPLLLEIVDAVIHRLDHAATRAFDPPGPAVSGYSDIFREPIVSDAASGSSVSGRTSSRQEKAVIKVPCQVESTLFEELRQSFAGGLPQSRMSLVFHRQDLLNLGLLDPAKGNILLSKGDRVEKLEKRNLGVSVLEFESPGLFITEIIPASWGFGPDGHDLHLAILERRDEGNL